MDEPDGCDPSLPGHTPRLVATRPLGLVAGTGCSGCPRVAGLHVRPDAREFEIDDDTPPSSCGCLPPLDLDH
eukprot:COSAG06_NODE_309_length_17782_cov_49.326698_18_plen_72_part_00